MNKIIGAAVIFFNVALGTLFAQGTGKATWPGGVALQQAPDPAKWEITFTYVKAPPPRPEDVGVIVTETGSKLQTLTVTKTGGMRAQDLVWKNGVKMSLWSNGGTHYMINQNQPPIPMPTSAAMDVHPALTSQGNDFPDMEWVSEKNYTGLQTARGVKCLVFQQGLSTVLVDMATRLPVRWTDGKETRDYQFMAPPDQMLEWPSEIQSDEEKIKRVEANKNRRAPRGG